MAFPWNRHFQWSNFFLMLERWIFNIICVFMFWFYGVWMFTVYPESSLKLLGMLYCCGLCLEFLQMLVLLFYSDRWKHDLLLSAVLPLYPLYQVFMKAVDVFALTREILFHESGDDNFVPAHVRKATWRW